MTLKHAIARCLLLLSMWTGCAWAGIGTNTMAIATNTVAGIPSCLNYKIKGACFWLTCTALGCSVNVSVRVEHYMPDAVVSVYHEPALHPWLDYGRPIAVASAGLGTTILSLPLDSAGTHTRDDRTARNNLFRDADAIGNPLDFLSYLNGSGGGSLTSPSVIAVPTTAEMMNFPSTLSAIASSWASVPQSLMTSAVASTTSAANLSQMANSVTAGVGQLGGQLSSTLNGSTLNISSSGNGSSSSSGGFTLPSPPSGLSLICPPAAKPFGLYFLSRLDGFSWRDYFSAEMLYPGSWIPGIREIGSFPANSWSSLFPRDGNVTQEHMVKGAAVIAQRVGDIISRHAQPHVYAYLGVSGEANGVRYFQDPQVWENNPGNTLWQQIYPQSLPTCSAFGVNDSISLVSWGDGHTSGEESYAFNLWHKYDCCSKVGMVFLFSIP